MGRRRDETSADDAGLRLDKWLWAARFFKTRALAREAVENGRVEVNGVRAKPSRVVQVGQELRITSPRGEFVIVIERLSAQRVSPAVAASLYREHEESRLRREALAELHHLSRSIAPAERPNTQDRQQLRRLKEGGEG